MRVRRVAFKGSGSVNRFKEPDPLNLGRRRRRALLPSLEAVPAELVGGANLVGVPIRIEPSLLLGPPSAVPREIEAAPLASTLDDDRSHEVRAPRTRVDVQPFDGELGVGMEQLIDQPDYLDPRNVAGNRNRGDLSARREGDDVGFELGGRARARQQSSVDGHGRNIQMVTARAGSAGLTTRTKLTAGSAQARPGPRSQW